MLLTGAQNQGPRLGGFHRRSGAGLWSVSLSLSRFIRFDFDLCFFPVFSFFPLLFVAYYSCGFTKSKESVRYCEKTQVYPNLSSMAEKVDGLIKACVSSSVAEEAADVLSCENDSMPKEADGLIVTIDSSIFVDETSDFHNSCV